MIRRIAESAIALIGLVLSSPVIIACMVAVRATSQGPAFFVQERVGKDLRTFHCVKLRTMWRDTAHVPTHQAAAGAVTPVGRFLRRTKLDELPQLWNVLRGEMSFVGPRPCLPTQEELIEARRSRGIYSIRPGITGLAQVRRVDMSEPERLAVIDAEYLARRSTSLDLWILFATLLPGVKVP